MGWGRAEKNNGGKNNGNLEKHWKTKKNKYESYKKKQMDNVYTPKTKLINNKNETVEFGGTPNTKTMENAGGACGKQGRV